MQARSQATRDALLAAGRALLNDRDFDALSVADLAAATGLSVGSFYGRFHDKDAYFNALQERITGEWLGAVAAMMQEAAVRLPDTTALVRQICTEVQRLLLLDAGFMRSCLKRTSREPAHWEPIRRAGVAVVEQVVAALVPRLPHLPAAQRAARVRVAMQVVYGTINNAIIHDPGPLRAQDPRLGRELARVMCLYLALPAAAQAARARGRLADASPSARQKTWRRPRPPGEHA